MCPHALILFWVKESLDGKGELAGVHVTGSQTPLGSQNQLHDVLKVTTYYQKPLL